MQVRRRGFTIVEMLVAMALVIFIMVILSEAFRAGLDTFRELKAVGDMQEKLRATATMLRRDLQAEHFEAGRRLSDPNWFIAGQPKVGFVRIQGWPSVWEDNDGFGVPSFRATSDILHFALKL